MLHKHVNKLSDEEIKGLRQKVRTQREGLPEFQYAQLIGEDDELGVQKTKKALIKLPEGSEYEGEWVGGNRHGRGMQTWKDGSIYEGYWKNDMTNGRGRMIHANSSVYEGSWKDGQADGTGLFTN